MSHHHHHEEHHHHHDGPPHHHQPDKHAVIRNDKSGLVLDASDYEVKLQHFTGFPSQLWKVEAAEPGRFILVNKHTNNVLDIQGGLKAGANLITFKKHGGVNQQWHLNSDGTIVSAGANLAVDICREHYHPGTHLIAYKTHGKANQKFELQYQ